MEIEQEIQIQLNTALEELWNASGIKEGDLFVVGCSSSEILGGQIGHDSSREIGETVAKTIFASLKARKIYLAAQCCEHLNRCLVVEEELAIRRGYEIVNAVPQFKAGGSFATAVYAMMEHPVLVERVQAEAGIDIGDTFIGMHLKPVAVPVRLSVSSIGQAHLTCARTRPKYIGGERAVYDEKLK